MKEDIKAQWVAALRSGEYTQGKEVLRTVDNNYCCLGVLCDLAVKAGVTNEVATTTDTGEITGWQYGPTTSSDYLTEGMEGGTLPLDVVLWAGLEDGSPELRPEKEEDTFGPSLIGLNDDVGLSFEEIADRIEAEL